MLGHELRNPLSPIVTALQLMKLQGDGGNETARTIIERQVTHLTRLVDDLLDVSRIARGKVELKTQVMELAEILVKAIEMASPLVEERGHMLSVDVPTRGLGINADPTRMSQVISNLLTNAAKYTPPGGRISVQAQRIGDEVVLRVRDTGMGIPPEILPRIFELFVQDRQAIDRSQGGLGIGLSIVRNLVAHHGGSVSAHSDGLGCGTEFVVRLPWVARPDAVAPAVGTPVSAASLRTPGASASPRHRRQQRWFDHAGQGTHAPRARHAHDARCPHGVASCRGVSPGRRRGRHRLTRDERLRAGDPSATHSRPRRSKADCAHRVQPRVRPAEVTSGRF